VHVTPRGVCIGAHIASHATRFYTFKGLRTSMNPADFGKLNRVTGFHNASSCSICSISSKSPATFARHRAFQGESGDHMVCREQPTAVRSDPSHTATFGDGVSGSLRGATSRSGSDLLGNAQRQARRLRVQRINHGTGNQGGGTAFFHRLSHTMFIAHSCSAMGCGAAYRRLLGTAPQPLLRPARESFVPASLAPAEPDEIWLPAGPLGWRRLVFPLS
jgi:hypothetical protein